ncbi:hypothetical protein ADK51_21655 [Streptomyces sp. WM6368]|nr:hypothetical protein ADK51_21655 [Streptomyces sp. WM6368]
MPFLRPVPIVVLSAMQNRAQDRAGAYTNQSQFRVLSPQLHSFGSPFPADPVQERYGRGGPCLLTGAAAAMTTR